MAAVYVQDQIEFSPQWQAIVGLRYDRFDVDFHNNRTGTPTSRATDNLLSPRAGPGLQADRAGVAVRQLQHDLSAALGRAAVVADAHQPSLRSRRVHQLRGRREVGSRPGPVLHRRRLSPGPHQRRRARIRPIRRRSILVDGQRIKGVEIGLAGNITEAWSVMGGYAWQDGEMPGQLGANVPQLPEHTASLWNRYDFNEQLGRGPRRDLPRRAVSPTSTTPSW